MKRAQQTENKQAWLDLGWQVAGALFAVAVIGALGWLFYRVEGQPCTVNPGGDECAEVRLDVAKAEPIENQCVPFQRVTGERGRNCKRFYIPQGTEGRQVQANSKSVRDLGVGSGGVGEQGPGGSGGGLAPADGGSDGGSAPGKGGGSAPDGPQQPDAPADPGQSPAPNPSPVVVTPPSSESAPGKSPVLPATVEATGKAAGEVVDKAGGTATGVVGGATDAVCKLTNSCGP